MQREERQSQSAQKPSLPKRVRRPPSAVRSIYGLESLEPRTLLSADLAGAAQSFAPEPVSTTAPLVILADAPPAASNPDSVTPGSAIGRFGTASGNADPSLTFHASDGASVTFSLDGAGDGEVLQDQKGLTIRLHGTDEQSLLRIETAGGNDRVIIENVSVGGALGALIAPTADLVGDLAAEGPIGSLAMRNLEGGTISAPSVRGLAVLGHVNQSTLLIGTQLGNDARIGGTAQAADVFGPGSIGALYVGGSMSGATVRIGQDPVDGTFDNGNDVLQGGRDSAVTFLRIDGGLSADTRFVGGAFPATIQLAGERVAVEGDGRFRTAPEGPLATEDVVPATIQPGMSSIPGGNPAPVALTFASNPDLPETRPVTENVLPAPTQAGVSPVPGGNPSSDIAQTLGSNPDHVTESVLAAPPLAAVTSPTVASPAIVTQSLVSDPHTPSNAAAPPSPGTSEWASVVALWKSQMLEYGRRHGQELTDLASGTPSDQKDATYYDAERVFYQIAAYTGDPSWANYAQTAERYYRDGYVLPNQGVVPGYWNFTQGLRMDYEQTHDAASREAIILLSQNAAFANPITPVEWSESAQYSREVAYAIMSYVNAEAVGAAPIPREAQLIDQAMRHIDQWFVSKSASYMPFMVGLTTQALIHAYEQTPDPRIQTAVATAVNGLWQEAWLPSATAFYYAGTNPTEAAPDLNMLIAPAYAWMYRQTGDVTYRDRGDAIFAGGVHNAYLEPMKQFDQNYAWSFDYLTYRG